MERLGRRENWILYNVILECYLADTTILASSASYRDHYALFGGRYDGLHMSLWFFQSLLWVSRRPVVGF